MPGIPAWLILFLVAGMIALAALTEKRQAEWATDCDHAREMVERCELSETLWP